MRVVMGPGSCYTILHNNVHVCMILFIKETVTNEIEKKTRDGKYFPQAFYPPGSRFNMQSCIHTLVVFFYLLNYWYRMIGGKYA